MICFSPPRPDWLWGRPSLLLKSAGDKGVGTPASVIVKKPKDLLSIQAHLTIICGKQNGLLSQLVDAVLLEDRNQNVNLSLKMLAQVLLGQVLSYPCKWTAKTMTSNFVENQELIEVQCLLRRSCCRESPEVIVLTRVLFVAFDHFFSPWLCNCVHPPLDIKELYYFIYRKLCEASIMYM